MLGRVWNQTLRWLPLLATLPVYPQTAQNWRFWGASDGLRESFSRSVSRAPNGDIWVRHGSVAEMSVIGGFDVKLIPDPRRA